MGWVLDLYGWGQGSMVLYVVNMVMNSWVRGCKVFVAQLSRHLDSVAEN
jgi:hypothetical protein